MESHNTARWRAAYLLFVTAAFFPQFSATPPHDAPFPNSVLTRPLANGQQTDPGRKSEARHSIEELLQPDDWVARGGSWSIVGKTVVAQGVHTLGRGIFYYKKRIFADFVFEVRLNKLSEDGAFGLLIRYDEKNKTGYIYLLFPHGGYKFAIIRGEPDSSLFLEPAVGMNKGNNVWNTIKIVGRGARFDLYMNDHRLTSITNHAFASGRVGFFIASEPRQKAVFEIVTLKSL